MSIRRVPLSYKNNKFSTNNVAHENIETHLDTSFLPPKNTYQISLSLSLHRASLSLK